MSQRPSFPHVNHRPSFNMNGRSSNSHSGTPRPSVQDGHSRPADVVDSFNSGYIGGVDIMAFGNGQNAPKQQPLYDRARFAGQQYNPLLQFYLDPHEPWNPQRQSGRAHPESVPYAFNSYRDTTVPSEGGTSIGPGNHSLDSGYGSQPGTLSVYGDMDRSSEALVNQFEQFKIPHGTGRSHSQVQDTDHTRDSWNHLGLARAVPVLTNPMSSGLQCGECAKILKSQSEYKKHIARHEKPHRCPEEGCSRTDGFGTANDLERHMKSLHRKDGVRYRCIHEICLSKAKDWPRKDNFRSHLKKIHNIQLEPDDSFEEYVHRPSNPEVLSNVGVAPQLIPPSDNGSVPSPSWSRLGQDTRMRLSGSEGHNGNLSIGGAMPIYRGTANDQMENGTDQDKDHISNPEDGQSLENSLDIPQQVDDQDLDSVDDVLSDVHALDEDKQDSPPQDRTVQAVSSGERAGFVRPDELSTLTPITSSSFCGATTGNGNVIILDDDEDVAFGEDSSDGGNHNRNQDSSTDGRRNVAFLSAPELLQNSRPKVSETGPDSDAAVKRSLPRLAQLPGPRAHTSSSDESDDLDPERAKAQLQELLEKLDKSVVEKLLGDKGYQAKREEPPAKTKKSAKAQNTPPEAKVECPEAGCDKKFHRQCEMRKHMKRHAKPYGCTQCSRRFGSKNDWKRHENSQHFQHETWKCDQKLKLLPLAAHTNNNDEPPEPCNKVCHRRETFKHHLVMHHELEGSRIDEKLESCRIGRHGEARFWCGFCNDVIEVPDPGDVTSLNARYDHIAEHYTGLNGAARKDASEWRDGKSDHSDADQKMPPFVKVKGDSSSSTPEPKAGRKVTAPAAGGRKRNRHGGLPDPKRAKVSSPRDLLIWNCCQCEQAWNYANVIRCLVCPNHERCRDCVYEEAEESGAE